MTSVMRLATIAVAALAALPARAGPASGPVDVRGEWTQFLGAAVAGAGDKAPRYGGRLDGFVTIRGENLGLWKGLSIELQGELLYGQSTNGIGSRLLLPVNASLSAPPVEDLEADLSFSIVQRIGRARVQVGKINLQESSSAIPIVGGGGKEGFQHVGLASPPALLAYPKIFGAILTAPAGRLILSLGVWTPDDWTQRFTPKGVFGGGTNAMFVATLPARIGGQQGLHSFSLLLTSRQARVGENFPDVRPPPGLEGAPQPGRGGTHIKYAVQQYFWRDPANPKRGFGFFGHIGVSNGTPDILDWSMTAGIAGSPPWNERPADQMGIGYFRFSMAPRVQEVLASRLPVGDEQGVEVYYTAQVSPALRLTAHGQLIDPVVNAAPMAAYVGLRAKADF
jgi:porin